MRLDDEREQNEKKIVGAKLNVYLPHVLYMHGGDRVNFNVIPKVIIWSPDHAARAV
jgi:hypothetical protein